jgi:hypothetical protein
VYLTSFLNPARDFSARFDYSNRTLPSLLTSEPLLLTVAHVCVVVVSWFISFYSNHDLKGQQQDPDPSANQIHPTLTLYGTAYTALTIEDHDEFVAIDTESSESSIHYHAGCAHPT